MAADPFPWTCWKHGPASPNAWGCPECMRELRTDDKQMAAFILLHYGTPRKLADLLYEIYRSMDDEIFDEDSQFAIGSAAQDIDLQAGERQELDEEGYCPNCAGSGEGMHDGSRCTVCNGRGEVRMCDYEDRDND